MHSTTRVTPFRLTYGTEVVIPIEVEELTWRKMHPLSEVDNFKEIREEDE